MGDDELKCGNTDFEDGLAGWYSESKDSSYRFSWTMASDAVYAGGTVLDYDHTYMNSTGHYMWAPGNTPGMVQ